MILNFQYYWEASGDFLQDQWNSVYDLFGSDFALAVWGTSIVTTLFYWIVGLGYTIVDLTGRPEFLQKYKIQKNADYPVSFSKVLKVTLQVMILVKLSQHSKGLHSKLHFHIVMNEIIFYYVHRILHLPFVYKYIHKRHHEWSAPIAITAIYGHPLEHISANIVSVLSSFLILGSHMSVCWLWLNVAIFFTVNNHSGYQFPLMSSSPKFHDYHHMKFDQNYGLLGILDWMHGTDLSYRKRKEY
ncbi:fatty acid hydroxylase domain-containing protein 2 [Trichonephila inaurata madagascariensis]|uniref:Fatty acid hydroxylase domain-containing protein 2 n=1 Tax=Trichonephila inaurata madagascariensis TaxID=2747483 RepID=A0A8X7BPK6_9ARAC|nr:fatty acid hydroxylase domain-containing protein 2 [Trichonephila inaurata madagascariensis]